MGTVVAQGEGRTRLEASMPTALNLPNLLSSLRIAREAELVIALAERVARQHSEQAASALERVSDRSPSAQLALVRLRLSRGQREAAREAAMRSTKHSALSCSGPVGIVLTVGQAPSGSSSEGDVAQCGSAAPARACARESAARSTSGLTQAGGG